MSDLRAALRQHRRRPAFALTVVGTLAIAAGATTAVFSVVSGVLLRALPYATPERLVWVASVRADNPAAPFTLPEYLDYRGQTRALSGLAAYASWSASLAGDGAAERLNGARMSGNAFEVLGLTPAAGRLLNEADDRSEAPKVVVLGHRLWQRRFGGSPGAVGRAVRINGEPYVIAGVLPARFPLPLRDIEAVTALVPDRDPLRHQRGSVNFLRLFGRLSPGADAAAARAELTAVCKALKQRFPVEYARKESVSVVPLREALVGDLRRPMLLLLGAVLAVLGAALANLVSLALVRANARRGELAMRSALGASRPRLARQLSVEALLLAVLGSAAGWPIALLLTRGATAWAPSSIARLDEVGLDGTVLAFMALLTALVAALLALAPFAAAVRTPAAEALRAGRGAVGDRWNHRFRNAMVVSEVAAALVLSLATLALTQGLLRLRDLDPGFRPDGVFQARVTLPPAYRTPEDVIRFHDRLAERLAATSGVRSAGAISVAPLSGLLATVPFTVEGRPAAERDKVMANLRALSPGYLETVGTRLLRGRPFSDADRTGAVPVALVSAALAERFLSGGGLGQRLLIDDNNDGPRPVEVVGVVENVRHVALDLPPSLDVYVPMRQLHADGVSLVRGNQFWMVRTSGDPAAFRATFLAHLRAVDPDGAVSGAGTMRAFVEAWLGPRRFHLGLFAAFAATAVLLAVLGLYGLVSYAVSQRAAEIGLRMCLGASARDVRRMVLGQAARLGAGGVAVGLALSAALRPLVAGAAEATVTATSVAATAVSLLAVVALGAWLPSRRAARIDPMLALRAE